MKDFATTTVNAVKPVCNNNHPWDTEFVAAVVGKCFLQTKQNKLHLPIFSKFCSKLSLLSLKKFNFSKIRAFKVINQNLLYHE